MFSTSSRWIRAALALSPTPSKFSRWSVVLLLPHTLHFLNSPLGCFFFFFFTCLQDKERIVGCTGSPADSHDVLWFNVSTEKPRRCPECGSGMCLSYVVVVTMMTTDVSPPKRTLSTLRPKPRLCRKSPPKIPRTRTRTHTKQERARGRFNLE